MATFILNEGYDSELKIEAYNFSEQGTFTIFINDLKEKVYAVPTGRVHNIRRSE